MAEHATCVVVFEACGSANYWAREMEQLGHEAKLIAPQYVRPFVKRQKNDAADAEAIVIAALRPEMRFVEPKTKGQQAKAVLFRGRERLVHQRTELVNALRAVLYEFGHVFPIGLAHLQGIEALVEDPACDLPALIIAECQDLLVQIAEKTERIVNKTRKLKVLAAETDTARRLQTMPGVGPLTALAVEAFAPDMAQFSCGRDFAAWLGLVPRQHSTGGKTRLGRISKAGQVDIRRLLIIGAPLMHVNMHCRAVDVPAELGESQIGPRGILAGTYAGKETADADRNRLGEQDGQTDLGHAYERGGLQRSGVDLNGRMIEQIGIGKTSESGRATKLGVEIWARSADHHTWCDCGGRSPKANEVWYDQPHMKSRRGERP